MDQGRQTVRVTILNQTYNLLASGDPAEVERLAESVDRLMQTIAEKAPSADSTRIAVMACLHLADQLCDLDRSLIALRERVQRKSGEYSLLLDQAMIDQATERE